MPSFPNRCICSFYVDSNDVCERVCRQQQMPTITTEVSSLGAVSVAAYNPRDGRVAKRVSQDHDTSRTHRLFQSESDLLEKQALINLKLVELPLGWCLWRSQLIFT